MLDTLLMISGLLLASAEHAPDAPPSTWAFNLTGLLFVAVVAYRNREK